MITIKMYYVTHGWDQVAWNEDLQRWELWEYNSDVVDSCVVGWEFGGEITIDQCHDEYPEDLGSFEYVNELEFDAADEPLIEYDEEHNAWDLEAEEFIMQANEAGPLYWHSIILDGLLDSVEDDVMVDLLQYILSRRPLLYIVNKIGLTKPLRAFA